MKKSIIALSVITSLFLFSCSKEVENTTANDKAAIETLLKSYQDALNASDANKVVQLFTSNGVLMANAAPTAEGSAAVRGTYEYVFANFTYTLQFSILDVVI